MAHTYETTYAPPANFFGVAPEPVFPYPEIHGSHFNPDLQAKLDKLATETGRPTAELVEDAVAGYFDELVQTREMLDSRYDDLRSGRVKPIDGEDPGLGI